MKKMHSKRGQLIHDDFFIRPNCSLDHARNNLNNEYSNNTTLTHYIKKNMKDRPNSNEMAEEENVFDAYFDSNISLLKLAALWVYDEDVLKRKKIFQAAYNIFWCTYIGLLYFPTELLYLVYSFGDLNEFLRSLRDNGNHISLLYKSVNFFVMRRDLINLIDILQHGNYHFEEFEDFRPKAIVKEEKEQAVRWTTYFWYFCNAICACMFFTGLFTFFVLGEKEYVVKDDGEKIYQQALPLAIVPPFGIETRIKFFFTFLHTMISATFMAWMIVALDSLYITLMSCVSAHLRILEGAFKTMRSRCVKNLHFEVSDIEKSLRDPEELENEVQKEMIKCIQHLQVVFRVSEKLEAIYNVQTLFQTFVSLGEMCFCLYLLSETDNQNTDQNIGNELTYLLATGFELLLYCWFGNRITEASNGISFALYDGDWFPMSLSLRKQMIMTMTRMKRPIYVTIGKITPLTFTTFLTMVRGAYSFFTFLKQRHGIRKN